MRGCLRTSGFVRVITPTFMHGFQNYLTQLLSLGRRSAIWNIFLGRLKVKVTLEGHINELFWAITPIYMHGFQNNFPQVFSLKCRSAIWNICFMHVHLSPPPPPPEKKKKKSQIRIPCQFIEKYAPPKKKLDSLSKKSLTINTPCPTRPDHTHVPLPRPFFLIWIICQLDSV